MVEAGIGEADGMEDIKTSGWQEIQEHTKAESFRDEQRQGILSRNKKRDGDLNLTTLPAVPTAHQGQQSGDTIVDTS
jgi:hypothetical protein